MSYNTNAETFDKFANGKSGVTNKTGTLETRELQDGSVELVSYGWQRLALYDDGGIVVFTGWRDWAKKQDEDAETTPRHVRELEKVADVTRNAAPQIASPPSSVGEIGHVGRHE